MTSMSFYRDLIVVGQRLARSIRETMQIVAAAHIHDPLSCCLEGIQRHLENLPWLEGRQNQDIENMSLRMMSRRTRLRLTLMKSVQTWLMQLKTFALIMVYTTVEVSEMFAFIGRSVLLCLFSGISYIFLNIASQVGTGAITYLTFVNMFSIVSFHFFCIYFLYLLNQNLLLLKEFVPSMLHQKIRPIYLYIYVTNTYRYCKSAIHCLALWFWDVRLLYIIEQYEFQSFLRVRCLGRCRFIHILVTNLILEHGRAKKCSKCLSNQICRYIWRSNILQEKDVESSQDKAANFVPFHRARSEGRIPGEERVLIGQSPTIREFPCASINFLPAVQRENHKQKHSLILNSTPSTSSIITATKSLQFPLLLFVPASSFFLVI